MERVVIVGASLAGLNAAEALRDDGFEGRITLIGEEPQRPYDRPPLSKQLLTGEWDTDRLPLRSADEFAQLQLEFLGGRAATGLDVGQQLVALDDGQSVEFDGLVIASGAREIRLPFGRELAGVHALRSQADALRIRDDMEAGGKLAVIGAGFIGAEVASSARARGLEVAMIEALAAPMIGPLGDELADWAADLHLAAGVRLYMRSKVTDLIGSGRVEAVGLEDGSRIAADTVVVGIGVRPNVEWLEGSGLTIGDGVVCDQFCRAAPMIYAAGDIARWPNVLFTHFRYDQPQRTTRIEHWTNAVEQGMAAARNLLLESRGEALEAFAPVPYFWSDQHGLSIMASGVTSPRDEFQLVHGSLESNRFAAIYGLRGHLTGVVAVGWPRMLRRYQALIRRQVSWEEALESAREIED
ncbi:MAG: FAD-dependent oxidoreductase [Chloroflexi bacterium]|nr:FAD-dependent oxidoreductase [Chloroflexota bacterium]MCY3587234.1 FAD-dependent oxidoreductase [Chloroflexota bacterium]MCY3685360.1 FAD-dependent oxidoreductase [Chloroflexota bacterium]MDE2707485.1 FAD-dependent oxidoreductase [Chloroflexota bacterium]